MKAISGVSKHGWNNVALNPHRFCVVALVLLSPLVFLWRTAWLREPTMPFASSLQAKNLKNRNIGSAVSMFSTLGVWCQCCKFGDHDAAKRLDAHP